MILKKSYGMAEATFLFNLQSTTDRNFDIRNFQDILEFHSNVYLEYVIKFAVPIFQSPWRSL